MKTLFLTILLLVLIVIAIWLPRGLALDRFVTIDETKWLDRSANFYLALAKGDFADTYQKEHPGVTIMWAETKYNHTNIERLRQNDGMKPSSLSIVNPRIETF